MTELIHRELYQVFIMFYCGLAVMIVFSVRDSVMELCRRNRRLSAAVYFASWLCAAFLFCQFLYRGSHGVLTVYGILSFSAGIFLWKKAICVILFPGRLSARQMDRDFYGDEEDEKEKDKGADRKIRAGRRTEKRRLLPRREKKDRPSKEKDKA